ncbi:hypothetical protein I316_03295 [Kwoniella heveanensis BCC8398]|uniref:Uncharacterized protein n=1 Tax=Kwoniella heveanensis BCC8398 TaxID=1296120 RepID=A0A1B9GUM9_9TREE|nr:hypothetical protein I316_03295 [Kwoniella heveanensis BCC8398]
MCYWPGLLGNATTDICCFETYDCSEQVCGAQNVSVIYGNGTSYCYLNATIAEIKFNQVGNETCKMMGCEYLQSVKNAANGGSQFMSSQVELSQMYTADLASSAPSDPSSPLPTPVPSESLNTR